MTHFELCRKTAEWAMKKFRGRLCLYEYQSFATDEYPDVLLFNDITTLFEIKMSKSDFLADAKKDSRIKYKNRWRYTQYRGSTGNEFKTLVPELYYVEEPHLGKKRYYVCPKGIIQPEEIPKGWGLYWVSGNKFYKKVESKHFQRDIHDELNIALHAFRKYVHSHPKKVNILIQQF